MKQALIALMLVLGIAAKGQSLYFPPISGSTWDTLSPAALNWCPERIDSLYNYLDAHNTDAFIVLKGGKIVLEHYFGTFTADSVHYWASAGKSLTALLVGIAQEQGMLTINDSVSNHIGVGWTTAPAAKEQAITIKHLLTMTSGLNDTVSTPCTNEDTSAACLRYLADAGTRWAYHTGAYRKLHTVVSSASGMNYNLFTSTYVGNHTGISGLWYDGVFYSKPRSMARFGLLALARGIWNNDTLLHDTSYFHAMVNTSQTFNQSYGYLWWLNGKSSFISPGSQYVFTGPLIANAPADMVCALGKNDQKIYVVPSQELVVVRVGGSAYGVALAFSPFDNELWGKIDSLGYGCLTGLGAIADRITPTIYPNPGNETLTITGCNNCTIRLFDVMGRPAGIYTSANSKLSIDCREFTPGMYVVKATDASGGQWQRKVMVVH